ncbi:hypothetical protein ACFLWY_03720, partial [Chloroflexota bacterium]
VKYKGKVLAIILRADYEPDGVSFVTSNDNPLQLGVMGHKRGVKIKPHVHKNLTKTLTEMQEVLHVEYGKVEAEFYNEDGSKIQSVALRCGDTILLLSGGHGFTVSEDCKMIEIKQGPYHGVEADKELLKTSEAVDEVV